MQFFKQTTKFDFMGKRKNFMILSSVLVVLSLVLVFAIEPKFGIDFMGGTEIQIEFQNSVDPGQIRGLLADMGFEGSEVVSFGAGDSEYLIRLREISRISDKVKKDARALFKKEFDGKGLSRFEFSPGGDKLTLRTGVEVPIADVDAAAVKADLNLGVAIESVGRNAAEDDSQSKKCEGATCTWPYQDMQIYEVSLMGVAEQVMEGVRKESWGEGAVKMRSEWVGPKVGKQLRNAGISSLLYALLFIMLYIAVRFDLRFAPGAVVALMHDVIITMGIFTVLRVEVTLATVAALLTIVGYSLNDTIVVFDRIRENLLKIRERKLSAVINISLNETLSRTLLTSLTTLLAVVVLLSVGWKTSLRDFSFALAVGVLVGTYSSVFVASPIVVWLDNYFVKKKA